MMQISEAKKTEFWEYLSAQPRPPKLTQARMKRLRAWVWTDTDFWNDIVARHGGISQTAEELHHSDPAVFDHCLGNFHGMLLQTLWEHDHV